MAIFRNSKKSESLLRLVNFRFWLKFNQINVLLTAENQSKLVNSDWIDVGKCFAKLSSSEYNFHYSYLFSKL